MRKSEKTKFVFYSVMSGSQRDLYSIWQMTKVIRASLANKVAAVFLVISVLAVLGLWFTWTSSQLGTCSTNLECLNPTIDSSMGKAVLVVCIFQLLVTFWTWFTISKEQMNYLPLFDFQIVHFLYRPMFNLLYQKFYNFTKTRPITVISSQKWSDD